MIAYAISKGEGTLIAYGICHRFDFSEVLARVSTSDSVDLTVITGPADEFPGMGE